MYLCTGITVQFKLATGAAMHNNIVLLCTITNEYLDMFKINISNSTLRIPTSSKH